MLMNENKRNRLKEILKWEGGPREGRTTTAAADDDDDEKNFLRDMGFIHCTLIFDFGFFCVDIYERHAAFLLYFSLPMFFPLEKEVEEGTCAHV